MNTSIEEKREIVALSLKQILNSFPVVGPVLTDILFTYRNNVRQNRLNHFVGLLEDEFIKLDIDLKTLKTEENLDLFEGIFKKVAESRSESKRVAFKNLLLTGLKNADQINRCDVFSEILLSISETELLVLKKIQDFLVGGKGLLPEKQRLQEELFHVEQLDKSRPNQSFSSQMVHPFTKEQLQKTIDTLERRLNEYETQCSASSFGLSDGEYRYALQNLFAKGLLSDDGVGALEVRPFEIMSLTDFGTSFLNFIEYEN